MTFEFNEILRFDREKLFIYCLENGNYQEQEQSNVLPILSKSVILNFLTRRREKSENTLL
ncbi:hypothetical protein [Okeania sp.]|uniref:hypothetical protein n=1 Tax=Okeania sp. TaxID=3100323 RepID=UPI002B4B0DCE|nr:hypothetical protein [Okeania sp.]